MLSANSKKIIRQYVGEIPILQNIVHQLGIKNILGRYISTHSNEKVNAIDSLILLIYNITCGRQPLYELEEWTNEQRTILYYD